MLSKRIFWVFIIFFAILMLIGVLLFLLSSNDTAKSLGAWLTIIFSILITVFVAIFRPGYFIANMAINTAGGEIIKAL